LSSIVGGDRRLNVATDQCSIFSSADKIDYTDLSLRLAVFVGGQATAVGRQRTTAAQRYVIGGSARSRAADRQVLAGVDAVTMTTRQLPEQVAEGL